MSDSVLEQMVAYAVRHTPELAIKEMVLLTQRVAELEQELARGQEALPGPDPAGRQRPLYCSCRAVNGDDPACRVHGTFETDITRANNLIAEWGLIAQSIAQQCKWRPQGKCLLHCQGMAVCNLDGLTLVDPQGRSVEVAQASSGTGVPPVDPKP
jgi:hypothetical protein